MLINIYGFYPNHLDIETYAVQKSTEYFLDIGKLCLKSQLDEYDRYKILHTFDKWLFIEVLTQTEYRDDQLCPLAGFILKNEERNFVSRDLIYSEKSFLEIFPKYLNVPYLWGAKSPHSTDCSGLVYQIYQEQGIILPRFADGQFKVTQEVNPLNLQPGDLIFIVVHKPVHVMLYLGNSQIFESCGLPKVYTTRIITFKEKWGLEINELFNGMQILEYQIFFRKILKTY